jgi:hypothetical protein
MAHQSTPPLDPIPVSIQTRRWALRVLCFMLVVQACGMIGVALQRLSSINWQLDPSHLISSVQALNAAGLAVVLLPMGIITAFTALGLYLVRPGAWLRAMWIQGFVLAGCLFFYLDGRANNLVYGIMLFSILIVWYLNTNEVRTAFYARHPRRNRTQRSA